MRPARGATFTASGSFSAGIFQSTRPVRGATKAFNQANAEANISIHAPRAGRDQEGKQAYGSNEQFQSTRPVRGATGAVGGHGVVQMISIHAPRAGRDTIAAISAMHSS